MAELPARARVVIIGGGAVGASALYHLGLAGWRDCVLVERNELTAGSTWHAAGNVPTFSSSWAIFLMQRYSTALYRELGERVGYPMNYHVTGSIRLAHGRERMQEFRRVAGMARLADAADAGGRSGMEMELLGPSEITARYPFAETHGLEGALYDPADGDIDPAQLTQALAKGARDEGGTIVRFCPVTGVRRENEEWIVVTERGEIACECVVNAAGYYAPRVAAMFGEAGHPRRAPLPATVMSHQYILFDEIPELRAWSAENGGKLPLLRDVDSSYYLRQEKFGMNLGPYERECRAEWVAPDAADVPDDFSFQLWPDDLERLEWYLEDAVARVPILGTAGLQKVINGPIPYTPDGNPLVGPMPGVPNAFEAATFTFGICQAGGAGKVLAEWVTQGASEWDMWACDPRRFTAHASEPDYAVAKAKEVYGHEYAMHFPRHAWPAGRPQLVSPVHGRVDALGAVWGAVAGWERALWFAREGDDTGEAATQTWRRDGPWAARVREECEAVRDGCGILDLPGFTRLNVEGPDVAAWLDAQITGTVPRVGRVGLGYFCDERGRLVTEMSMVRHSDTKLTLVSAAAARWHDREWLERTLPADVTLTDETENWTTQLVTGPRSREVIAACADGFDPDLPWLSRQSARIAGRSVTLLRVSFAGERGWEVHSRVTDTPAVWDALWAAGRGVMRPFGMFALDSLRIEKGYRTWKGDLSAEHGPVALGLERFVRRDKAFAGRRAVENERQQGPARRFAALSVEANGHDAPPMSSVWAGGEIVGETTSGAYGHRARTSIALAMLRPDMAEPGTALEVEIFGERFGATVHDGAHWDAGNERMRG